MLLSCCDVFSLEMQTLEDPVPKVGHSYCLKETTFPSNAFETSEIVSIVLCDVCKHSLIVDVENPSCSRAKFLPRSLDVL